MSDYVKTIKPEKKLQLEILDTEGNTLVTHHFHFDAEKENMLRLKIEDSYYILNHNGKFIQIIE